MIAMLKYKDIFEIDKHYSYWSENYIGPDFIAANKQECRDKVIDHCIACHNFPDDDKCKGSVKNMMLTNRYPKPYCDICGKLDKVETTYFPKLGEELAVCKECYKKKIEYNGKD